MGQRYPQKRSGLNGCRCGQLCALLSTREGGHSSDSSRVVMWPSRLISSRLSFARSPVPARAARAVPTARASLMQRAVPHSELSGAVLWPPLRPHSICLLLS